MKKLILSFIATTVMASSQAQIATDDFDNNTAADFTALGNFTAEVSAGVAHISSTGGHDEWEAMSYEFGAPFSVTGKDSIKVWMSAIADEIAGDQPTVGLYLLDGDGNQTLNTANTGINKVTVGTESSLFAIPIVSLYDEWAGQSVLDSTDIISLKFAINNGFGSQASNNADGDLIDHYYTGTITIDSIAIVSGVTDTGIESLFPLAKVAAYPNPSSGLVNVATTSSSQVKMNVSDVLGNIMTQNAVPVGQQVKQLTFTTPGIYFVSLTDGTSIQTQKLMIK